MHNKFQKINAFSLAELVIALGVISILAMIATPLLSSKKTTAQSIKFKKTYYTTEQIIKHLISDSGNYLSDAGFAYTTPIEDEGLTNKFCYWFKTSLNLKKDYHCPNIGDEGSKLFAQTTDNALWYFYPADFTISETNFDNKIIVDVNGYEKPNCLSSNDCEIYKPSAYSCNCSNPDTFIIGVRYDGKMNIINDETVIKILEDQKSFKE